MIKTQVLKRDHSTVQDFDINKLGRVIKSAFKSSNSEYRGVDSTAAIARLTGQVISRISTIKNPVAIEQVQDAVEFVLINNGYIDVARKYILYREQRSNTREIRLEPDKNAIADYMHPAKYSRFLKDKQRRETYLETVERVEEMHVKRFPKLKDEIEEAFVLVKEKKILPSMRSMQFAGKAVEKINARQFNCSFMLVDNMKAFRDTLYLLLCGCGVGYSVQYDHVEKLPKLKYVDNRSVIHHTIEDTIEGWANALDALMKSYVKGHYVEFSYHKIRNVGKPLKTSGGKAPGHIALKSALDNIRKILDKSQGRQLRPIECYDIQCFAADAVLSGGIRRSATIALFSLEDGEMMSAKTGNWWEINPQRANSNNSVVLLRNTVQKRQFKRVFKCIKEFGEPGFVFTFSYDVGFNPCVEINLNPVLDIDDWTISVIERKRAEGQTIPKVKRGQQYTGTAFCNLVELNAAVFETLDDMVRAAVMGARIGTLQAAYTSFPYLGWISEIIAEREALLGVSMTGMKDSPIISLDQANQSMAALAAVEENKRFAEKLGIRQAARVTCVKPAGSTSLELGCVAPGVHDHHARRYFRRVTANENEPVFRYFKSINPHMCVKKPNGDWVIEFPVSAPIGASIKGDTSAIEFLEIVKSTQLNWVRPGTARPLSTEGACHNVSNTVIVKDEEWDQVAEYVWKNKDVFSGVSFLPFTGDKDFAFAPNEAVSTDADEEKWNNLLKHYTPVDYSKMVEHEDTTNLTGEIACSGNSCELNL